MEEKTGGGISSDKNKNDNRPTLPIIRKRGYYVLKSLISFASNTMTCNYVADRYGKIEHRI